MTTERLFIRETYAGKAANFQPVYSLFYTIRFIIYMKLGQNYKRNN